MGMRREPRRTNTNSHSAGKSVHEYVKLRMPPCVVAAFLQTWFNGWATCRFQEGGARCKLNSHRSGENSLEHYVVCPHAWSCTTQVLQVVGGLRHLGRFFGFQPVVGDKPWELARQMFALYGVYDHTKHKLRHPMEQGGLKHAYAERYCFAQTLPHSLRRVVAVERAATATHHGRKRRRNVTIERGVVPVFVQGAVLSTVIV